MGNGLYLGNKGLSLGTGLYQNNTGLWSGATGFQAQGGDSGTTYHILLENGSGSILTESGSYILLESAP